MKEKSEKSKNIVELEKLAKQVLELKQEREQRRPLLIEFCGSPKSGKSTTITSLNIFLKRNGFNTVVLTERASICPIGNKTHHFFNLWTMTSAMAEIIKHLDSGAGKIDIILSDRGVFDSLCWFEWLNKNPSVSSPYLDNKGYEDIKRFVLSDLWRDYIDLIYVFNVEPNTSIRREYSNLLTEKRGTIMTEQVLNGFNKAIENTIKNHRDKFRSIQILKTDTPELDNEPNSVGYSVTKQILENLKELLIEKIGYFPKEITKKLKYGMNNFNLIKNHEILFDNRDKVELEDFIQPIAITVITNPKRSKVLVVKKGIKRTSQNSPERDKLLTYIGGHIRIEDLKTNTSNTLRQTLHREIQEEIGESISIQENSPFLIYTPDNPISKKHLAVCYVIEMDLEDKKFKLVSDEFIMKTGTSKSGHILSINEIIKSTKPKVKGKAKDQVENWSRIILNNLFKTKIPLIKSISTITMFDDDF